MAFQNCCGGFRSSKSILKGIEYKLPNDLSVADYFRKCIIDKTINADSPAVMAEDGSTVSLTFRTLDSLSTKFAKALRQYLGFWTCNNPDGDLVMAFALPISEYIPMVLLAILKLGAAFLAIPIIYSQHFIAKIVSVTRPMIVITESNESVESLCDYVHGLVTLVNFDVILNMALHGGFDDINEVFPLETLTRPSARIASIVFTAGTMDQQLAVRIGHPEILNRCLWQYKEFPYMEGELQALSSGLEDADSLGEIFAPLLAGIPLQLIPRQCQSQPSVLLTRIRDTKISRITLAPPSLNALLTAYEELDESEKALQPLQSVKYWTVNGEAMSHELVNRFFSLISPTSLSSCHNVQHHQRTDAKLKTPYDVSLSSLPVTLIHLYGSTEVMSDVTYETFTSYSEMEDKFKDEKVSIGKPIGNTIVYIVDEDMRVVENGVIGEICIAGAPVASGGYVSGTEKEDTERFCINPFTKKKGYTTVYQTEDYGRILFKEGVPHLVYEGRTEMTAKVKGKRVDLRDIAKLVNETKLVEQCYALCFHPGKVDQAIVAFCKLLPRVSKEKLQEALANTIKFNYLMPKIFPVEQYYYLPSGRLDKHKLLKQFFYQTMNATPEEWKTVPLSHQQQNSARILFAAIAKYTKTTLKHVIAHHTSSLWALGVSSMNALAIFLYLRENGSFINIDTFLRAENLLSIVAGMSTKTKSDHTIANAVIQRSKLSALPHEKFYANLLRKEDKESVFDMLIKSYATKNDICKYLQITAEELRKLLEAQWKQVMKDNLSMVAYSQSGGETKPVGVIIVLDATENVKTHSYCSQNIKYWIELVSSTDKAPKEHIVWKKKGAVSQILFMGTSETMSTQDNLLIAALLLEAVKIGAKTRGYDGTIISCANSLMTDMCEGFLNYKVLEEVSIYKFRAKDKTLPFRLMSEYKTMQVLYESF